MSTGNDPVRLIADPGCPESQRALLRLGADIAPPRDAEARVWTALAGALGGAAVAAGAAADASTKTITTATNVKTGLMSVKVVALTAGLTALGVLGIAVLVTTRTAPRGAPAGRAPRRRAAPRRRCRSRRRRRHAPAPPADRPRPAPTHPDVHRAFRSPARRLGEETTSIRDARQALRAGNAARALRLLEESRQLVSDGRAAARARAADHRGARQGRPPRGRVGARGGVPSPIPRQPARERDPRARSRRAGDALMSIARLLRLRCCRRGRVVLLARAAQAAPATAALETTSGPGAADCPDATSWRPS